MIFDFAKENLTDQEKAYFDSNTAVMLYDNANFSEEAIAAIKGYPPLALALNEFLTGGGKIVYDESAPNEYDHDRNEITLGEKGYKSDSQYEAVSILAHELTHALSPLRKSFHEKYHANPGDPEHKNISSQTYASALHMVEAEALYYQFVVLCRMYPSKKQLETKAWEDNSGPNEIHNLYEGISDEIKKYQSLEDLYDPTKPIPPLSNELHKELAGLNSQLIAPPFVSPISKTETGVPFTYDERAKITWLLNTTDIGNDYLEAFGIKRNPNLKKVVEEILKEAKHLLNFKILVNQAHAKSDSGTNYFGSNSGETLEAEKDGSVLGKGLGTRNEVLWGGGGDDIIYGSNVNDILMGGDGNDKIYGNAGDNILAGNRGHDQLYGGDDKDILNGGSGHDRLYGGDGDDAYVFDLTSATDAAPDIIRDKDGKGGITLYLPNGANDVIELDLAATYIYRDSGMPKNIYRQYHDSDKTYDDPNIWYHFQPSPESETIGSLFVYSNNTLVTIIQNFNKKHASGSYLGLTLDDNDTDPQWSKPDLVLDPDKDHYVEISTSDDMEIDLSAENKNDVVIGGGGSDKITLGNGSNYVNAGGGSDIIEGGEGHDYIRAGSDELPWTINRACVARL